FRSDGNVIHIIGGDDKPVSVTGNEYDTTYGATTFDLSYDGNAVEENTDRTLKHYKKFYSEEGCPFGDDCTFVHDLESKYRERTTILLSGGGSSSMKRGRRDTSAVPPVAPPPVLAVLPAWPRSAAPTSPLAPQPLPAAEADATVKPVNWRTRISLLVISNRMFAGTACKGAEQRSGQTTWKLPKKINGIYGDWIDDIQYKGLKTKQKNGDFQESFDNVFTFIEVQTKS
ncbi:zinc finger (CCCH-type) family protein, partial [Tanacetum coccineum]